MALSPLDEYLQSLRGAGESFNEAAQGFAQLGQTRDLSNQLRDLGSSGLDEDKQAIARSLIASRDAKGLRDFMTAEKAPKIGQGYADFLKAEGIQAPDSLMEGLAKADNATARAGFNDILDYTNAKKNRAQAGQFSAAEQRRQDQFKQQQMKDWAKDFNKLNDSIEQEDRAFSKVQEAIKQGTLPADAVVFNFLARNLAGEKGPLSDQDRAQFIARAFGGDMQKFQNFLSGKSTSVLQPAQRKAFQQLVGTAARNFEKYKDEAVGERLSRANDYMDLVKDGKIDPRIERRAKQWGFEAEAEKDTGLVNFKKKGKSIKTSIPGSREGGDDLGWSKIKSPEIQFEVQKIFDEMPNLSEEERKTVIQNALKAQGG